MPDAASPRQPAALLPAPPGSDSGLVRLLEAWLEPLAAVLSLWALAAWREGALTLPWAFTGVLAKDAEIRVKAVGADGRDVLWTQG